MTTFLQVFELLMWYAAGTARKLWKCHYLEHNSAPVMEEPLIDALNA